MQNSAFRTRIRGPGRSKTPLVAFACETATSGPEWQVSIGPRHDLSFCACKTSWLTSENLVSMGPSPHLWFLQAKQRLSDQNYKSLWVPTSPVVLCIQNSVICTRMTSLYWFQPLSVVLCMQNSDFRTRLTSLCGSQTSCVVLTTHNSVLSTRIKRLYLFHPLPVVLCMQNSAFRTRIRGPGGSKTPLVAFACKTATSGPEWQVSMGPRHDLSFCASKTAWLASQ